MGSNREAALAPGEIHHYRLPVEQGQFLRLVVEQRGIDAAVRLTGADGAVLLAVDRLINDRGPELVLAVAEQSGLVEVEVEGLSASHRGRYEIRLEARHAASAAERASAGAYLRFAAAAARPPEEAIGEWTAALATWRELGEEALAGEALERLARSRTERGERATAVELYTEAAAAFRRAGEVRFEAIAENGATLNLVALGRAEEALARGASALKLARRAGDPVAEAKALHHLGQAHQNLGELQAALDRYEAALALWPAEERLLRPHTLHGLGVLYARYLRDVARGRELLLAARDAWLPAWGSNKAATLSQLGRLEAEAGNTAAARRAFEEALVLRREKDPCGSAVHLARLALVEEAEGRGATAEARRAQALTLVRAQPCPRNEPTVEALSAGLAEERGDAREALLGFRRAAMLASAQGDRLGEAECLLGQARALGALGEGGAALAASRRALDTLERVRPTVLREDLRTAFFAGAHPAYELTVDLLLAAGRGEEAWVTAEAARARSLRDLVAEAGLGGAAAPELREPIRAASRRLNALESQRLALREADRERQEQVRGQIAAAVGELERLRGEVRRVRPRAAAPAPAQPLSLAAVRRALLDPETLLLEIQLGEEASTLWTISLEGFQAHRLPPRRELEPLAREALAHMKSLEWPGTFPPALCRLSELVLGPAAAELGARRLLLVPDGALTELSFAALPDPRAPCAQAPALVDEHELVILPSVAALLEQRQRLAGRTAAAGWLAVVADPSSAQPDARLPEAGAEAAAITAGLPAEKVLLATGTAASRELVASGRLGAYRIVHFAAHGLLDAGEPLLSALALAELDSSGGRIASTLAAHEIYDLELPAELVVLSACDTARGRQVAGEGLVAGLPRAFLAAGAARVLLSLWAVDDASTRELMVLVYRGLLERGLAPATALRAAQVELRRRGLAPRAWAGFALVGDWRPLPPFTP